MSFPHAWAQELPFSRVPLFFSQAIGDPLLTGAMRDERGKPDVLFSVRTAWSSVEVLAAYGAQRHAEAWESEDMVALPWDQCAATVEQWRDAAAQPMINMASAPAASDAAASTASCDVLSQAVATMRAALECEWIRRRGQGGALPLG
jgi:hypothetical protein